MTPPDFEYWYKARVVSVYDGDTVHLDIDLGFKNWMMDEVIRLYGINAPELRGASHDAGIASRDWLREQIPIGTEIIIQSYRDHSGKYGRWLATLWRNGLNINAEMVKLGLAVEYMV